MPGPQPWKDNTYSKGQGQPLQPWESPIQRRLRREQGEKEIEERTEHSTKDRPECQQRRRNSRGNDRIGSADERAEQQSQEPCCWLFQPQEQDGESDQKKRNGK